jgi:hypothetical protein
MDEGWINQSHPLHFCREGGKFEITEEVLSSIALVSGECFSAIKGCQELLLTSVFRLLQLTSSL